ncbi:predicted protein [Sclerotinia sclerotiorum 1980 UF-70]|uniref:Uncharacterized protein n=1 Tax=Sclerotinia sclerotiorum (strain ATCC 18683 / 1980 / Ss-1) TaxID=665079 RepID=A7ESQ3_SCLS1|nr:predicted protein [Sclerotinia sclerotiorum 1980 UF-70]EDN92495.1 predicted protein [Sclerotinia sclerotiorum 1980 UF-70]
MRYQGKASARCSTYKPSIQDKEREGRGNYGVQYKGREGVMDTSQRDTTKRLQTTRTAAATKL